uniref:Large ribosomal subunit protein mL62 n=1 Tax=Evadne anonyx TaxID=141404 RepID=A0A9N6WSL8_9CRUS|nr:EOG090X0JCO [Evadne anonyx]
MAINFRNVLLLRRNFTTLINNRAYLSSFSSNYSLDKLYPHSRLDITTLPKVPGTQDGKFSGFIPIDKLEVSYSRSSGPGGQNVNCVSTKAEVRFQIATANWIPEQIRSKLAEQMKNQITKEGYLVTKSDRTRSQQLNLADAMDKLRGLIFNAAESLAVREASPESLEKHRRLRERAAREQLREKRMRSMTKQGRQAPTLD